jgi:hypothetical protein
MTQYLLRFLPWLFVILIRYPLAFIAVAFSKDNNLRTPFHWLETIDNDLTGDSGWKTEHLSGSDPTSYKNKVRWIWRNGGNRFNYYTIGVSYSNRPSWAFWSQKAIPLIAGRFLDLRFGWTDYELQGRCKFVFTIRVKTKP